MHHELVTRIAPPSVILADGGAILLAINVQARGDKRKEPVASANRHSLCHVGLDHIDDQVDICLGGFHGCAALSPWRMQR